MVLFEAFFFWFFLKPFNYQSVCLVNKESDLAYIIYMSEPVHY